MLDFIWGLVWQPVASDQVNFLVAMLTKSKEQKVIVNERKLPSVVITAIGELVHMLLKIGVIFKIVVFLFILLWIIWVFPIRVVAVTMTIE